MLPALHPPCRKHSLAGFRRSLQGRGFLPRHRRFPPGIPPDSSGDEGGGSGKIPHLPPAPLQQEFRAAGGGYTPEEGKRIQGVHLRRKGLPAEQDKVHHLQRRRDAARIRGGEEHTQRLRGRGWQDCHLHRPRNLRPFPPREHQAQRREERTAHHQRPELLQHRGLCSAYRLRSGRIRRPRAYVRREGPRARGGEDILQGRGRGIRVGARPEQTVPLPFFGRGASPHKQARFQDLGHPQGQRQAQGQGHSQGPHPALRQAPRHQGLRFFGGYLPAGRARDLLYVRGYSRPGSGHHRRQTRYGG